MRERQRRSFVASRGAIRDATSSHNSIAICPFWESTIGNEFWETILPGVMCFPSLPPRSRPRFVCGKES